MRNYSAVSTVFGTHLSVSRIASRLIQRSRLIGRIVVLELALEALHLSQNPAVIFWAFQHPLAGVQQPLANAGVDIVRDGNAVTRQRIFSLASDNVLGGTGSSVQAMPSHMKAINVTGL